MNRLILAVAFLGMVGAAGAKESSKERDTAIIKDEEAVKCIKTRLEEQTGTKGWKIELKDLAGTARDFTASNGGRSEHGTVNVAKNYPNPGALRVYLAPRD
jgi:hypothetical protein